MTDIKSFYKISLETQDRNQVNFFDFLTKNPNLKNVLSGGMACVCEGGGGRGCGTGVSEFLFFWGK